MTILTKLTSIRQMRFRKDVIEYCLTERFYIAINSAKVFSFVENMHILPLH